MPFKPGNKNGSGRPKGSLNKRTYLAEEVLSKYDFDPLEFLLMVAANDREAIGLAEDEIIRLSDRVAAAKEVSKYLYAAKQSVALSNDDGGIRIVIEDYAKKDK